MNIRAEYKVIESDWSFLIYPFTASLPAARRWIFGVIPAAIVWFFFRDLVGEKWWAVVYVVMGYCILHSLYEIFINAHVNYRFSVADNAVYKSTSFYKEKKILSLSEVVIFTSNEMGSWHYAMGARKSQFVKNYTISENFGSGKKNNVRLVAYEQEILAPIYKMIESLNK